MFYLVVLIMFNSLQYVIYTMNSNNLNWDKIKNCGEVYCYTNQNSTTPISTQL